MPLDFQLPRLSFSGALVGVALTGELGFDTSTNGAAGVAAALSAGSTWLYFK
jgi:hypothetical protein